MKPLSIASLITMLFVVVKSQAQPMPFPLPCEDGVFGIGVGQSDITGPIAESSMMGYADFEQRAHGLHMRLRARAFVIYDPCSHRMSAIVVADLGMIFSSVKDGVLAALRREYQDQFRHENLLLTATHTHSGPGGFAYYPLYNVTTLGFDRANYEAIVGGITESVKRAMRSLTAGRISYGAREVPGVGFNRSLAAYENNPRIERSAYAQPNNETMHLLKFENSDGKVIGAINWLSVHPVSLTMKNDLVSGDNKGLAAYLLERRMNATYRQEDEFVAAFAQADAGDVSPYDVTRPPRNADEEWTGLWQSAEMQANAAWSLLNDQLKPVLGSLDFRHQFVDMQRHIVSTSVHERAVCSAALGLSFAAGTENGKPALALFDEGVVNERPEHSCHREKPILLAAGDLNLVPNILPFQILRLGEITIVAAPAEMTTMAGRRLRADLSTIQQGPIIISGLSNEYSHYVATREEYAFQHYEGASTLYGPWTERAYRDIFSHLARALVAHGSVDGGPVPPDQSHRAKDLSPGVIFDAAPIGKKFGDVATDAQKRYRRGEMVSVSFIGAHPKNDLKSNGSYLTVERLYGGAFRPVYYDTDPSTILRWRRVGLAESRITVEWRTTSHDTLGEYRICHSGGAKPFLSSRSEPYAGCSRAFALIP